MHHLQYIILVDHQRMPNTFPLFSVTILTEEHHSPLEELISKVGPLWYRLVTLICLSSLSGLNNAHRLKLQDALTC